MMRKVRLSYYLLIAIVALPILVYFFGAMWELLYSAVSLAILGCFVAVIYLVQSERRFNTDNDVEQDLHRQMSTVMIFVIAGILSAWHFYAGYSGRAVIPSTFTEIVALLVYSYGVVYMLYGAGRFFVKHGFR